MILLNPYYYFFKKFLFGFAMGVMLRLFVALIFRQEDVSLKGFFNAGWLMGAIYTALTYYVVMTG
jgi:hypothetical protein